MVGEYIGKKQKLPFKALRQLDEKEKYPSLTLTNLCSLQNDHLILLVMCSQKISPNK